MRAARWTSMPQFVTIAGSLVLLLGIFPRGAKPNPQREKLKKTNEIIAKLDDGSKTVKYLDIGDKFVQPDGSISKDIMNDYLHLTPAGYRIWATSRNFIPPGTALMSISEFSTATTCVPCR